MTSSREDREKTENWVEKRGVEYPYAWDPGGSLMGWFGVRGIPHAVLVAPSGEIVWRGHPSQLEESLLEKTLSSALETPIWEVQEIYTPLSEGRYADAIAAADKLGDGSNGAKIAALLRGKVSSKMASIEKAHEAGDFLTALKVSEKVAKELAGLPEAVKAAEIMQAIEQDADAQRIITGQIQLRTLVEKVDQVRTMSAAKALLEELKKTGESYKGTIVQRHARKAVKRLEQRMG